METFQETEDYMQSLMQRVREMVVSVQDEHDQLKHRLKGLHSKNCSHDIGSHSTTTDHPSTISSSSLSKPPSYKTATKFGHHPSATTSVELPPQPPVRQRRKNRHQVTRFMSASRGAFIVFEGLDRVGKSTLVKRLVEHLEQYNRPVFQCRFPDRSTKIGKIIDSILKDKERAVDDHVLHLQFSANRWELSGIIKDKLRDGITVIADRYAYSGVAYSSAKNLTFKWCCDTERGLPKPDLVIYLELSKEHQYERQGFGEERFETRQFQELVRARYEKLMRVTQEDWIKVDVTDKGPEELLSEIIIPVKRCIESRVSSTIGTLDFKNI